MDDLGPVSWLPGAAPPHEWEKLSIPWRSSLEKFPKILVVHTLGLTVTPSTPAAVEQERLSEADGGGHLVTWRWPGLGRAGRTRCHVPATAHITGEMKVAHQCPPVTRSQPGCHRAQQPQEKLTCSRSEGSMDRVPLFPTQVQNQQSHTNDQFKTN